MKHGHGKVLVDAFITIEQRMALCVRCGTRYTGPKKEVKCKGCGAMLESGDVSCVKKVPSGMWQITTMKKGKP